MRPVGYWDAQLRRAPTGASGPLPTHQTDNFQDGKRIQMGQNSDKSEWLAITFLRIHTTAAALAGMSAAGNLARSGA